MTRGGLVCALTGMLGLVLGMAGAQSPGVGPIQRRPPSREELLGLQPAAPNAPALPQLLAQLEPLLPPAQWRAEQQPWSKLMVAQVATMLEQRERADAVLRAWSDGRLLVWFSRTRPGQQVAVGVVRCLDAAGARAYFGLAVDLQRKQDEKLSAGLGPYRLLSSRPLMMALEGAEEVSGFAKELQLPGGPPLPVTSILARTGNLVIEISWHGLPADPRCNDRIARHLLAPAAP